MTGLGDLLYGGASGASTKLTGFTGGDGQLVVLTETTSGGGAAQAPAWVLPSTMTVGYAGTSTNVDGATNCILYNSSTNITGCISGVNNAVVVTNSSGTPSEVTTLPAANLPAPTTTVSSGAISVSGISNYVACTTTCTVTPITPAPGVQLCVRNAPGSATVITLAAQSGIYYELTTHAGWGTVNHTLVSGGVATDQICLVGYDATHYMVMSFTGTWTD